jgi:hypothetical protein
MQLSVNLRRKSNIIILKRDGQMKTFEKIIISVLVVILIFQFVLNSNIKKTNNVLSDRINSLQSILMSMQGSVSAEVNNVMNRIQQESSVVKIVQWDTVKMENGMVTVKCGAGFNNISKDFVPYVLYRDKTSESWIKTRLEPVEGLNYSVDVSLKPDIAYEYQIFIDGETKYSGNIDTIPDYLYTYTGFRGMLQGSYDPQEKNRKNYLSINLQMTSKVLLKELQIKEAYVVLYSSGTQAGKVIMKPRVNNNGQGAKQDNSSDKAALAVAAGDPFYGDLSADIDIASYKKTIDRITVEVTYNDGYKAEQEVYPVNEESKR